MYAICILEVELLVLKDLLVFSETYYLPYYENLLRYIACNL